MKHANVSVFPILTLKAHKPVQWITIFLTALFAFASVPSASAKCLSRDDVRQPISQPPMAPAPALAAPLAAIVTPEHPASIVGLWNVTFLADGQPFDYGFDVFYGDGNELMNDVTPTIEGNVCVGVWQQIASRTYTLKHVTWSFDTSGNLSGSGVFHETLHLSKDGNSYSGTMESSFYDLSGNLTGQFAGRIEATRIKPD